jgi:hypothetical protein
MIPALISYILLNLFLARAKRQSGSEVNDSRKAEIIAKVERIVNVINCVVAIWFKFIFALAIVATILIGLLILGILLEWEMLTSIAILEYGTVVQVVDSFGRTNAIIALALTPIPLIGITYLLMRVFSNRNNK